MRVENGAPHVNPARENAANDRSARRAVEGTDDAPGGADRVEISLEARGLHAGKPNAAEEASPGTDARTMRILENLKNGYYDSSEAIDALADELMIAFGI